MKKSQLRNIIKEQIKEIKLLKEQTSPIAILQPTSVTDQWRAYCPLNSYMTLVYGYQGPAYNTGGTAPNDYAPSYAPSGVIYFKCENSPVTPPSGCPTCDPSAWSGLTSWTNTWTNSGPFNNSNTNQPCTHICNKIQDWTDDCANAGPVQANQLACKIQEGQNQSTIHGCNC